MVIYGEVYTFALICVKLSKYTCIKKKGFLWRKNMIHVAFFLVIFSARQVLGCEATASCTRKSDGSTRARDRDWEDHGIVLGMGSIIPSNSGYPDSR